MAGANLAKARDTNRGIVFPIHLESPDDRVREYLKDFDGNDGIEVCCPIAAYGMKKLISQ
jgi:hypothetical protein